jgi:hypothetical protein
MGNKVDLHAIDEQIQMKNQIAEIEKKRSNVLGTKMLI